MEPLVMPLPRRAEPTDASPATSRAADHVLPAAGARSNDEHASGCNGESALASLVRSALRDGHLPVHIPAETWGGPGQGQSCEVCRAPIACDQMELEFDQAGPDDAPRQGKMHVRCFEAWTREVHASGGLPSREPNGNISDREHGPRPEGDT